MAWQSTTPTYLLRSYTISLNDEKNSSKQTNKQTNSLSSMDKETPQYQREIKEKRVRYAGKRGKCKQWYMCVVMHYASLKPMTLPVSRLPFPSREEKENEDDEEVEVEDSPQPHARMNNPNPPSHPPKMPCIPFPSLPTSLTSTPIFTSQSYRKPPNIRHHKNKT